MRPRLSLESTEEDARKLDLLVHFQLDPVHLFVVVFPLPDDMSGSNGVKWLLDLDGEIERISASHIAILGEPRIGVVDEVGFRGELLNRVFMCFDFDGERLSYGKRPGEPDEEFVALVKRKKVLPSSIGHRFDDDGAGLVSPGKLTELV